MARTANPYIADAGQYNGIGEGINNLANVFMNSGPDPVKAAQAQAYAWNGRESRENVLDSQDARQGRHATGDAITNWTPDQGLGGIIGQGIGSGAFDADQAGTLGRVIMANLGGSDDQLLRSVIGAGGNVDKNNAFSMGGQQNLADRDHGYAQSLQGQQDNAAMARLQETLKGNLAQERIKQGGGEGGLGGVFGLSPDQNRYLDAQETMRDELGPILQGYGVPTDDDGNLRTDLLPPGYFENIMQQATDAARADRFTRDISFYLDNAVRSQSEIPTGYTDDDIPIWGLGSEKLEMGAPQQGPDAAFGALFGNQPAQSRPSSAQPAAAGPLPSVRMPDGAIPTPQEIEETARNRGITPAQVIEQLEAAGGQRIPGA